APQVLRMRWDTLSIPTGETCPLADEQAIVTCTARDEDGDPYSITVTLVSLGPGTLSSRLPSTVTATFPGTTVLARTTHEVTASFVLVGAGARVQATCEVIDAHGLRDVRVGACF